MTQPLDGDEIKTDLKSAGTNSENPSKEEKKKRFNLVKLFLFLILTLIITLVICGIGFSIGLMVSSGEEISSPLPGDKIAYLELNGPILLSRPKGSSKKFIVSDEVVPFINKMREEKSVKGMLIVINSPGGSATASHEIYEAIMKFRKEKPVVVYIRDIAASGGYYIASSANYIVTSPNAIVGNIGVIMVNLNIRDMLNKLGIHPVVIKSAAHKDLLSSFRDPTPEEREILNKVIKDIYEVFKDSILKGRDGKLKREELEKIADGRIFSGVEAVKVKLADQVGSLEDAENKLKELMGVPKSKKLGKIRFKPKTSDLSELFDRFIPSPPEVHLYSTPRVLYR